MKSTVRARWAGAHEFMFWKSFSYDWKGPCHCWKSETKAKKTEAKIKLQQMNDELEAVEKANWEIINGMKRFSTRNLPGKKPVWKWNKDHEKFVRKKGKRGIDWWRYQNVILLSKLIPFVKECNERRKNRNQSDMILQKNKASVHVSKHQLPVFSRHGIERIMVWQFSRPQHDRTVLALNETSYNFQRCFYRPTANQRTLDSYMIWTASGKNSGMDWKNFSSYNQSYRTGGRQRIFWKPFERWRKNQKRQKTVEKIERKNADAMLSTVCCINVNFFNSLINFNSQLISKIKHFWYETGDSRTTYFGAVNPSIKRRVSSPLAAQKIPKKSPNRFKKMIRTAVSFRPKRRWMLVVRN